MKKARTTIGMAGVILAMLISIPATLRAQNDDAMARVSRSDIYRQRHYFTIVHNVYSIPDFGLFYNISTGFGGAASLMNLYSTQPRTPYISLSDLTISVGITVREAYWLGIRGTNFMHDDLFRIDYAIYFQHTVSDFWGVGYLDATTRDPVAMRQNSDFAAGEFAVRIADYTYLGALVRYNSTTGRPDDMTYLDGLRQRYDCLGLGASLTYESRDNLSYSERGSFVRIVPRVYTPLSRGGAAFWGVEATADHYFPVWKGGIAAIDLHATLNDGQVPWTLMPAVGSTSRMRGYYPGRFRDNNLVEAQAELRQHIYGRLGVAAFAGAANVFPSLAGFNWSHTLPNYGGGVRIQVDDNTRLRIDAGFGRHSWGIVGALHEAF